MRWNPFKPRPSAASTPVAEKPRGHFLGRTIPGAFSTDKRRQMEALNEGWGKYLATLPGVPATDDASTGHPIFKGPNFGAIPEELLGWYANQSFIGYNLCAIIAQQWLVDKACSIPARDAMRHGFDIQVYGTENPDEKKKVDDDLVKANKKYGLRRNLQQFVRFGRVFGIRVAFFKFEGVSPEFYEKPFNPDGIPKGSYRGISQVDPYWCVPMLSTESASDPSAIHFYEPEWWIINGQKYHRSHLCIFRSAEVPDLLKPAYFYGGISVPQKILERVYASERTANEAPQLAMTKRTTTWKTDLATLYANQDNALKHLQMFTHYRDNFGVKVLDSEDDIQQLDTALADLDETIMTQFQLVAAAANVPATKLLGTAPKGFNSTGEYDESSYHEELEAIQEHDLTPMVERHHLCVLRSDYPEYAGYRVEIDWLPVDSPTAKEYAEINKLNAETDAALVGAAAIDGMDVRTRLRNDKNSGYTDLAEIELPDVTNDPLLGMLTDAPTNPTAPDVDA